MLLSWCGFKWSIYRNIQWLQHWCGSPGMLTWSVFLLLRIFSILLLYANGSCQDTHITEFKRAPRFCHMCLIPSRITAWTIHLASCAWRSHYYITLHLVMCSLTGWCTVAVFCHVPRCTTVSYCCQFLLQHSSHFCCPLSCWGVFQNTWVFDHVWWELPIWERKYVFFNKLITYFWKHNTLSSCVQKLLGDIWIFLIHIFFSCKKLTICPRLALMPWIPPLTPWIPHYLLSVLRPLTATSVDITHPECHFSLMYLQSVSSLSRY